MASEQTPLTGSVLLGGGVLLLVCGLFFFYHLDDAVVDSQAAARVLLTAQEMNERGTWIVPTVEGEVRWEKPPLYVWAVKLTSIVARSDVNAVIGRIPGGICMTLLVLLGAWWSYRHLNRYPRRDDVLMKPEEFALLTGLLLAANPYIFTVAREGVPDSMFALFCFGALVCLGESFESRRSFYSAHPWRQWVLLAYLLIGLAMLTKGPAAFFFVLIPYMFMCWTYRMTKPDWIHLPGLLLALVVGGWWYVTAIVIDPQAQRVFMSELFTRRFGPDAESHRPFYFYITEVFPYFLPWIVIAIPMMFKSIRRTERTPTLVTWSWVFLAGTIWLSIVGSKSNVYFIPVAPFVVLLAADALARWDFESVWGTIFRRFLIVLRVLALVAGFLLAIFVRSDWGIVLVILLVLSFGFDLRKTKARGGFESWQRTVFHAWAVAIIMVAFFAVYTIDYVPREGFISPNKAFVAKAEAIVPEDERLVLLGEDDAALFSYLLGEMLPLYHRLDALLESAAEEPTWMISDEDVDDLVEHPNLIPTVKKFGGDRMRVRTALFYVLPAGLEEEQLAEARRDFIREHPFRVAVIGDAGRGDDDSQEDIAEEISDLHEEEPIHEIVALGDPLSGDNRLERLDFARSFERPFRRVIRHGITFHGVLGDEDQAIDRTLRSYPLLQFGGRKYYSRTFYDNFVRLIVLDSAELSETEPEESEQWQWLQTELTHRDATWTVVALHTPLLSFAANPSIDQSLTERLLPLLDRYEVPLVLFSDEPFYQRIEDPAHAPVFIGGGWSGRTRSRKLIDDPRLKAASQEDPGFVLLEFTPDAIEFRAIDDSGDLIDEGRIVRNAETTETRLTATTADEGTGP